jgi:hypothetical protein
MEPKRLPAEHANLAHSDLQRRFKAPVLNGKIDSNCAYR